MTVCQNVLLICRYLPWAFMEYLGLGLQILFHYFAFVVNFVVNYKVVFYGVNYRSTSLMDFCLLKFNVNRFSIFNLILITSIKICVNRPS